MRATPTATVFGSAISGDEFVDTEIAEFVSDATEIFAKALKDSDVKVRRSAGNAIYKMTLANDVKYTFSRRERNKYFKH